MIDIDERHPDLEYARSAKTTTTACRVGRTTGAVRPACRRSRGHSRRGQGETMNTLISRSANGAINRFEGLTAGVAAGTRRVVRPSGLTGRDIETEVLLRLARKGYDWSGTLGRRRRAP